MGEGESGELVTEKDGYYRWGSFFLSSRPEKRFASYYTLSRHMEGEKKHLPRVPIFSIVCCAAVSGISKPLFLLVHGTECETESKIHVAMAECREVGAYLTHSRVPP